MRRGAIVLGAAVLLFGGLIASEPRAEEPPPWKGDQAGVGDEVLKPWTPVAAGAGGVEVWNRLYKFGALPLPSSATARGAELLDGPVTLSGTVGGKPVAWTGDGSRVVENKPNFARLEAAAESENLQCAGEIRVEYDGMIRCDLRIRPKDGKVGVDKLTLEVPLKASHALFLHTWPGSWGSAGNSAALPEAGHRGPFKPMVWLGDNDRGFAWFAESDQNFFNSDPNQVLEIAREGDRVVLRVHLIDAPHEIDGPLEYTFGFQATPARPDHPDAWDFKIVHMGSYSLDDARLDQLAALGVRTICFHESWTEIQNYTETTRGDDLKKLVAACHKRKIQLLLYFGYEMSDIAPEWDRYHEECLVEPRAGGYKRKPEQTAYIVCYRSHWQDFMARGIDRMMTEYGIDGVYLDGTSEPWGCENRRHGCGYERPDGSIGKTYTFFDTRSMMRRIATIVQRHNPDGQVNVHQSTCMTIPTLSFATSYWDGEQLQGLKRDHAALEILPLDAFRAEFMGRNWGVPAELLWYGSGPFKRVEAESLGLLHDIPTRPGGAPEELERLSRLWKTFDEFGRHEAQWMPYWSNESVVKTEPAGVKVSLYNRPGRGLIAVIVNTGKEPCDAAATFDLKALGQPADAIARDVLTDKETPIQNGRIAAPLGSLEHVVLWLKPR